MLQRLPTALTQVKAGNNSKQLLNKIRNNLFILCIKESIQLIIKSRQI